MFVEDGEYSEGVRQPRRLGQQVEEELEVPALGVEVHVEADLGRGVALDDGVVAVVHEAGAGAVAAGEDPLQLAHLGVDDPHEVVGGADDVEGDEGQREKVDDLKL